MDRYASTPALVDHEQFDSEDNSSGYESQETSDSESTPILIHATREPVNTINRQPVKIKEKMSYKNTAGLVENLKTISSIPELCDVMFEVGSEKVKVYGVKAILGTRSRVLYNLILKKEKEAEFLMKAEKKDKKKKTTSTSNRVTIVVKKYEPEDFRKIIQFIQSGSVDVNSSCVAGLLCGASQFGLDDLERACWEFVQNYIKQGNVSRIISSAKKYSHHRAGQRLLDMICSHIQHTADL